MQLQRSPLRGRSLLSLRVGVSWALLVPLLVIGLVLGGPAGRAAAAVQSSPEKSFVVGSDNVIAGNWWECEGIAYNYLTGDATQAGQNVRVAGDCDFGLVYRVAHGLGFNAYSGIKIDVTAKGTLTPLGLPCSGTTNGMLTDVGGFKLTTGSLGTVFPANGTLDQMSCLVTQVCVAIAKDVTWPQADVADEDCANVALGHPLLPGAGVEHTGTCPVGKPGPVSTSYRQPGTWYDKVWQVKIPWIHTPGGSIGGRAMTAFVVTKNGTTDQYVRMQGTVTYTGTNTLTLETTFSDTGQPSGQFPTNPPWGKIVGVQVFVDSPSWPTGQNTHFPPSSGSRLGRTDVANCEFWIGDKIANLPESDQDEPFGSVDNAPPPEPVFTDPGETADPADTCTFSLTDPSTWLEGGMCAAVGLLGAIWNSVKAVASAIGALASAIVGPIVNAIGSIAGAVVDGIEFLFVPDASSWGLDELYDDMKAKPPFSLVNGIKGTVQSAVDSFGGSGCSGDFIDMGDGMTVSCAAVRDSNGLGVLRAVVSAGLIGLTGFTVFNLLASAARKGGDGS